MKEIVIDFINSVLNSNYPVVGLVIVAFAESSFFPIPPDTILIPMALHNPLLAIVYAALTTISSVMGGVFGYFIGKKGGKPIVKRFLSDEKLYNVKLYFNKYDVWAILIAALTPIPYKVFTISAGLFDLNLKRFILASIAGRGARFLTLGILIYFFGPTVKTFLGRHFEVLSIVFTILLIGGFVLINFLLKKNKQQK